jgi:enoyl-CoA hydratase
MEAILTGEPITADRAYQLGMVNRLVEPVRAVEEAMAMAARVCAAAPLAVWESRQVVLASEYADEDTLKRMTDAAMGKMMASEDLKEGLTAFIEKRAPVWLGR